MSQRFRLCTLVLLLLSSLGLERANAIKKYLVSYGVSEGEITIYSKGEEDAEGTDEAGWAKDRKGEIE